MVGDEFQRNIQHFIKIQTDQPIFKSLLITLGFFFLMLLILNMVYSIFFGDINSDSFMVNNKIRESTIEDIQNLSSTDKIKLLFHSPNLNVNKNGLKYKYNHTDNKENEGRNTTPIELN